jgi:hypothetical protein
VAVSIVTGNPTASVVVDADGAAVVVVRAGVVVVAAVLPQAVKTTTVTADARKGILLKKTSS